MSHIPQSHCYINTEDVVLFHNFPAACILASGLFSGPFALALCMEECDNASQLWLSPAAGRLGLWLPNTCLALTPLRSGPPGDLRDLRTPHTAHSLERYPLQRHTSSTFNDICMTEHFATKCQRPGWATCVGEVGFMMRLDTLNEIYMKRICWPALLNPAS